VNIANKITTSDLNIKSGDVLLHCHLEFQSLVTRRSSLDIFRRSITDKPIRQSTNLIISQINHHEY